MIIQTASQDYSKPWVTIMKIVHHCPALLEIHVANRSSLEVRILDKRELTHSFLASVAYPEIINTEGGSS